MQILRGKFLFLFIFLSFNIEAKPLPYQKLKKRLDEILFSYKLNKDSIGIFFKDIKTGKVIYNFNENRLLNPASNIKIVTALASLYYLEPNFRYKTFLYGEVEEGKIKGDLYLKGTGDPTLRTKDLWFMGYQLLVKGVKEITGDIVVDDSYFDNNDLPPAYDQKPEDYSTYRASVSALSLNENVITINIRANKKVGLPATILTSAPGYLKIKNETVTSEKGGASIKVYIKRLPNERIIARIWGEIPLEAKTLRYRKRVDNPSLMAGYTFRYILRKLGIKVKGGVREGKIERTLSPIVVHLSAPLISFLWKLGKRSNNFFAETLLKTIGVIKYGRPGTWKKGIKAVERFLEKEIGIKKGSYRLINGSGLYDANRLSANQFVKILLYAWNNIKIRADFISQLAIGGIDGTLSRRFKNIKGYVRAKTGTLEDVVALSGYLFDKKGKRPVAFSILINNAKGKLYLGRKLQDEMVTEVVNFLNSQLYK